MSAAALRRHVNASLELFARKQHVHHMSPKDKDQDSMPRVDMRLHFLCLFCTSDLKSEQSSTESRTQLVV